MKRTKGLTPQQEKFYRFIVEFQRDNLVTPTMADIATEFHCSRANAFFMVSRLETKGFVKKGERGQIAFIQSPVPNAKKTSSV